MANLFEKPIPANPMSTFAELPLAFMDQALERKQQKYDIGMAKYNQMQDEFYKLGYLPGDAERHMQLQKQYDAQLDAIVDSVGGDYSRINPLLDRYTQELKRDINYGELGAQNRAYQRAVKLNEMHQKNLAEGKISQEGYQVFQQSMNNYQTVPLAEGSYSSFTGYVPSTIIDPLKFVQDSVDEVVGQYDQEGQEFRSKERILSNAMTKYATSTDLQKAIMEKGTTMEGILGQVISDKEYYKYAKTKGEGVSSQKNTYPPMVLKDMAIPAEASGELTYTGGSVPWLKKIASNVFGRDSWKEHNDWINSAEGKNVIKHMETFSGEKLPTTPSEQRDWLLKYADPRNQKLTTNPPTPQQRSLVTEDGRLTANVAVRDARTGEIIRSKDLMEILKPQKDGNGFRKSPEVVGAVQYGIGYNPGDIVILAPDGSMLIAENPNADDIVGEPYNWSQIELAGFTPTGQKVVNLEGNVGSIGAGTYEVSHKYDDNSYTLSQSGKPVFKAKNINGKITVIDLRNDE